MFALDQLLSEVSVQDKSRNKKKYCYNRRETKEREYMKMSILIVMFVILLSTSVVAVAKYNVIHIVADDLRPELG